MREASIPVRRLAWPPPDAGEDDALATREWLVTNGLGGYASGTISGVITRRYHGYLIAALPAPLGRMVMLSHIAVQVRYPDGRRIEVGGREQLHPVSNRGRRLPDRIPPGSGSAGLALRHQRPHPRNARLPHAHAEHGAPDVRAPGRREQRGARTASLGQLSSAGGAGQRAARLAVRVPRHRRSLRDRAEGHAAAAAAVDAAGRRRHVHAEGKAHRQHPVSRRGTSRLPGARRAVEPRVLPAAAAQGRTGDSRGVDRTVRIARGAPRGRGPRRRTQPQTAASRTCRPGGAGGSAGRARAGGRPVHRHTGRTNRGSGAGARGRR